MLYLFLKDNILFHNKIIENKIERRNQFLEPDWEFIKENRIRLGLKILPDNFG